MTKSVIQPNGRRMRRSSDAVLAFVRAIKAAKPGHSIVYIAPDAAYILELKEIRRREK